MGPRLPRGPARRTEATSILPDLPAPELVILPADSRSTALAALRAIAEQGEGLETPDDENDSHFVRFLTVYRALKALGPGIADVVRPLAANPRPARQRAVSRTTWTPRPRSPSPEARLWAHLFNVRYRKLLVNLSHAFELPTTGPT